MDPKLLVNIHLPAITWCDQQGIHLHGSIIILSSVYRHQSAIKLPVGEEAALTALDRGVFHWAMPPFRPAKWTFTIFSGQPKHSHWFCWSVWLGSVSCAIILLLSSLPVSEKIIWQWTKTSIFERIAGRVVFSCARSRSPHTRAHPDMYNIYIIYIYSIHTYNYPFERTSKLVDFGYTIFSYNPFCSVPLDFSIRFPLRNSPGGPPKFWRCIAAVFDQTYWSRRMLLNHLQLVTIINYK